MASVIVRADETVKGIVVLVGQPVFKLIVWACSQSVKAVRISSILVFAICMASISRTLTSWSSIYFLGNIRRGIDKGVFQQGNTVKRSAFRLTAYFSQICILP
jgi:hypothetical protein